MTYDAFQVKISSSLRSITQLYELTYGKNHGPLPNIKSWKFNSSPLKKWWLEEMFVSSWNGSFSGGQLSNFGGRKVTYNIHAPWRRLASVLWHQWHRWHLLLPYHQLIVCTSTRYGCSSVSRRKMVHTKVQLHSRDQLSWQTQEVLTRWTKTHEDLHQFFSKYLSIIANQYMYIERPAIF